MAREIAQRDNSLSIKHAEVIILQLCDEERVEYPPQAALAFLAQEFVTMVQHHTAA